MTHPSDVEARLSALESRMEEVAADAAAARHLAAARDRDLADLGIKVDANRSAINALGVQTAARFDRLEGRFDGLEGRFDRLEGEMRNGFAAVDQKFAAVDRGFAGIRGKLDQTAAGQQHIVDLLTGLISNQGDH